MLKNTFKVATNRMKDINLDEKLSQHVQYSDIAWKQRNDVRYFTSMINPQNIDKFKVGLTEFDIKTRAQVQKVFNEIDWEMISIQINKFMKKLVYDFEDRRMFKQIDKFVDAELIQPIRDLSYIDIPLQCLSHLSIMFEGELNIRYLPVKLDSVPAMMIAGLLEDHVDWIFQSRYYLLDKEIAQSSTLSQGFESRNYIDRMRRRHDKTGQPLNFKQSISWHIDPFNA